MMPDRSLFSVAVSALAIPGLLGLVMFFASDEWRVIRDRRKARR